MSAAGREGAAPAGGARGSLSRLPGTVTVHTGLAGIAEAAAAWLETIAREASAASGRFRIALAGGGTPRTLYELLASAPWRRRTRWDAWEVFFGDERAIPPEAGGSNFRMARESLLSRVPIPEERVHRMEAERVDLDAAAADYAAVLTAACPPWGPARVPRLDCVLLGLGENGHTVSLFPGDPSLDVTDRWVVRSRADYAPYDRLTLTFPVLDAAAHAAFLVAGAAKGEALRGVLRGDVPAARVHPRDGELRWFLDEAAAGAL